MFLRDSETLSVAVHTSKRHRQAVLSIQEPARTVKIVADRAIDINVDRRRPTDAPYTNEEREAVKLMVKEQWNRRIDDLISRHPLNLPFTLGEDDYKVTVELAEERINRRRLNDWCGHIKVRNDLYGFNDRPYGSVRTVPIRYIYELPATSIDLLIGTDEKSSFICALPRTCKSVDDAHEALRPKGVPKGSLRQGEFFFVPVTRAEHRFVTDQIERRNPIDYYRNRLHDRADNPKDHFAAIYVRNTKTNTDYALGPVTNRRHKTLILEGWYRVVPNLEIPVPQEMADAAWD